MPIILQCFLGSAVQEFIHSTMTWRFILKQLLKSTFLQQNKEHSQKKQQFQNHTTKPCLEIIWIISYELHAQKKLIWNVWVSWSSWQCLGNMSKLLLSIKPTICCLKPRLLTKKTGYRQYTENDLMTLNNTTNNEGSKAFNPSVFSLLLSGVSRNENCTGQLPKCFQLREPE